MFIYIAIVCFLIRAIPRYWRKNALVSDTYFHLFCANEIRENHFRLPERFARVIIPHRYTYPFLYHFFLALFPLRVRLWVERFTGAIFDTVSLMVIYVFSSWVVNDGNTKYDQNLPLLIAALFVFSPALLRLGSGPRAYNGSPRVVGQTFYIIHLLSAYYAYTSSNATLFWLVSIMAGAAMIITGKFATQVLLLFSPFIGFVDSRYFVLLALSLLTAVLITRGLAWRILVDHVNYLIFYARHLQSIFLYPYHRSLRMYLSSLTAVWKGGGRAFFDWFYQEQYFLHILLTVNTQFLILIRFIWYGFPSSLLERFLLLWMVAGFCWFLLTKWRLMLFLGEGERYLEYAVFPSLFMLVAYSTGKGTIIPIALLVYWVLSAFAYMNQYRNQYLPIQTQYHQSEALFQKLNELPPGTVLPIGSFHWRALYSSKHPVITYVNRDEKFLPLEEFMLIYGNYPYPSEHLSKIIECYKVMYIISDHAHLKHYKEKILKDPALFDQRVEILWEIPTLVIGRVHG